MRTLKKLTIIYHSQSNHTEQLAQAVLQGARKETDIETHLYKAANANLQNLIECDGVIFGTPENFGYMSGALKDFFDRTFYPAQSYALNLPYALFVSAGNDGTGAVSSIDRILIGYPMRKVSEPVISRGSLTREALDDCDELGQTIAAGIALGIF